MDVRDRPAIRDQHRTLPVRDALHTYSCRSGCLPAAPVSGLLFFPTDRLRREEPVSDAGRRPVGAAMV